MSEYHTHISLGDLGEVPAVVMYDYQPAERQTNNYPGCDESVEITDVVLSGVVLAPHLLHNLIKEYDRTILLDHEKALREEAAEAWATRNI